ncbi:flagellar hook-length control protein FliK [Phaeobacter sp. HF9A]|uniref:flagellar hook-length control protein FliK n=1 Tax=Phaeobacter sp. HF9A TaxID=2721561 RepID=UPI0014304759|nr:flagellar hook-length control protein FliK [Phaeobacter sp. HF9A]NIZ13286.1 flagellar hook-length control protein FliK [Phaeobacter sp. HF9A]
MTSVSAAQAEDHSAGQKAQARVGLSQATTSSVVSNTASGKPLTTQDAQTQPALTEGEPEVEPEAAPEAEETAMAASRASVLSDQQARAGRSEVLEAHREGARTARTEVPPSRGEQPNAAATDAPKPRTQRTEDGDIRVRDLPLTAAQTQIPSHVPQAGVRTQAPAPTRGSSTPGGMAATSTGVAGQTLSAGAALSSSSAMVQGVFGMSESARTGDDVVSYRGAEVFALPQLLAEASVRSGASSFRAETPRHVAQQLAEAVATAGKRNVDVSLNPKELGHVNMRLVTNDTGVSVVIQAERPETEDLMRRHIQDLAREFKEMGFTDISFQFGSDTDAGQSGGNEGSGQSGGSGLSGDGDVLSDAQAGQPLSHQLNITADGLDMRI